MSYHWEAYAKRFRRVEKQVAMESRAKKPKNQHLLNQEPSHDDLNRHNDDSSVDCELNMHDNDDDHSSHGAEKAEEEESTDEYDGVDSVTISLAGSSTSSNSDSGQSRTDCLLDFSQTRSQKKKDVSISMAESCSFELMRLLDAAGSPRNLYDKVNTLLRKHSKNGFQMGDAMSRKVLMKNLFEKFPCPKVQEVIVGAYHVYKLPFVAMLQNIIDVQGSCMYSIDPDIVCHDEDHVMKNRSELWNTQWMKDTFSKCESYQKFNTAEEIMLPLIIYMDKTGTDMLQRYSLEPVLFTTAAIPREQRNESSWRHLGFIPPCYKSDNNNTPGTNGESQLQLYHDVLGALLSDLIHAQKHPPIVTVIDEHGQTKELKARLPVMIVSGDQKSQDTLCGRKHSNSGGAGRVHRSCMCSFLSVDDPEQVCVDVCGKTIKKLTKSALISDAYISSLSVQHGVAISGTRGINRRVDRRVDMKERAVVSKFLTRQRKMNEKILQYPFTQHAIRNAFDDVDFGAWASGGIFKAAFDDFMHSTESGLFEYVGEAVFEGLTKTEKQGVESAIRKILGTIRSSARASFPRWRLKEGFTNMSLMTCAEKVGCVFMMAITFQYQDVLDIINKAKDRQITKYRTFPKPSPSKGNEEDSSSNSRKKKSKTSMGEPKGNAGAAGKYMEEQYPFVWERHMPLDVLNRHDIEKRLEAMARHGFDLNILDSLDSLQIHTLITHCNPPGDPSYPASYPKRNIPSHYKDLSLTFKVPEKLLKKAFEALTSPLEEDRKKKKKSLPETRRYMPVEGTVKKHYRIKPKQSGVGNTSAILTKKTESFQMFTEYLLSFHAFCRNSHTLPHYLQESYDLIDFGSRTVVRYFEKMVYRGDDSVDSKTTKVHANMRYGLNHKLLGTCMHADCQTGERMLKTKAKLISSTAQKRGSAVFEKQTMERVRDEVTLCRYESSTKKKKKHVLEDNDDFTVGSCIMITTSKTSRHKPDFRYDPATRTWTKLDRKGKPEGQGNIDNEITKALLILEPTLDVYELYGEVELTTRRVTPDNNSSPPAETTFIRATPNYKQSGPWYDFVQARWRLKDAEDQLLPPMVCPGRCLGFYKKKILLSPAQEAKEHIQLMALVHGSDALRQTRETLLTSHYFLQYNQGPVSPKIYALPIEDVLYPLFCIFREPHVALFNAKQNKFMAVRPRREWAYVWMSWNKVLQESNNERNLKDRDNQFVDLADKDLVDKVRKEFKEMYKFTTSD